MPRPCAGAAFAAALVGVVASASVAPAAIGTAGASAARVTATRAPTATRIVRPAGIAATGVAAATGGFGAVLGTLLAVMLARRRATDQAQQTVEGGQLLWVRTRSPELERRTLDILERNAAHHVHAHDLPV